MERGKHVAELRLCDACCDRSGTVKEMRKTGGCTCDICGWSCQCCLDDGRQFVNRIPVRLISAEGWPVLEERNRQALIPLDWQRLFAMRAQGASPENGGNDKLSSHR